MTDQAEKLMHNSKSRTARSWVSQDIQQEQASQGTRECVVAKNEQEHDSHFRFKGAQA